MPDTPMAPTTGVYSESRQPLETMSSGVAWPAIIGGAFATTFATITAVWLIVTQRLASGVGRYLTGRLLTKWAGLLPHEVFFRDTANGFLTWRRPRLSARLSSPRRHRLSSVGRPP